MAEKPLLYDRFGNELNWDTTPPDEGQADIGRVRDIWAGKTTGDVTPELLARVMRGDAELSEQMLLQKRMLRDYQISSCLRILSHRISRLEWEFLPFDDSAEAEKDADEITSFFNGLRFLRRMIAYLVYGEFFTFVGAGTPWTTDYTLDRFIAVDPPRWTRDREKNALRIKTVANQTKGEPVNPRAFIFHSSALAPGTTWDAGLWLPLAVPWLVTNATWGYWVRFAEQYGNPMIWAFFNRKEDKASVLNAVTSMAANARGVFPVGTDVKLQEAQRYGTSALYQAIIEVGNAAKTKLILGHQLNTDAKGDTGNLAGGAAADVSQQNAEGVARGIEESIQEQLVTTWYLFYRGEEQVLRGQMATFRIKTDPPQDLKNKAEVYVSVNETLAAVGRAIDPSQIEDEFAVRTVERPKVQPTAADPDPDGNSDDAGGGKTVDAKARRHASSRKLTTEDDVRRAGVKLIAKAAEDFSERIAEIFEGAPSIDEGIDLLWEGYGAMDTQRVSSGVRDATVVANLMGRGDAVE